MDNRFFKYFIIISIIFTVIFLLSIFIFPSIFQMHDPMTTDKIRITSIQNPNDFFTKILINNIIISFVIVMSGLLWSRWIPVIALSYNAFFIGELIATALKPDTILYVYLIIPHAIIELPTAILAATFGCYLAIKIQETTKHKYFIKYLESKDIFPTLIKYGIKPYITIILPLIIISCVIESYVSLYILRAIFNGS